MRGGKIEPVTGDTTIGNSPPPTYVKKRDHTVTHNVHCIQDTRIKFMNPRLLG
jgi:hypothetical protein